MHSYAWFIQKPMPLTRGAFLFACVIYRELDSFALALQFVCKKLMCLSFLLENYIDGEEFLSLSEHDIKSMVPPIGLSRKIFRLIQKHEVQFSL